MSEKQAFVRKNYVREKITLRKKVSITETSFGHRNKFFLSYLKRNTFLSQKKDSVTEFFSVTEKKKICQRKNLLLQKQVSVTKKFRQETGFCNKKVSFTETSFCNRNKSCHHACPLKLKVL